MSWLVQKQFNIFVGMTVPGFYNHSKIYTIYTIFVDVCLLSFAGSYFIAGWSEQNISKKIFSYSACIFCLQSLSAKLYMRYYGKRLLDLVEECTPYQGEDLSPQYRQTPRKLPYVMNMFVTVTCVIFDLSPLIPILNPEGKKRLAIPAYFPFSVNDSPNYEFAVIYEALSGLYTCGITVAFYDLYVNLGARLIAKYYYLRKALPRVINDKNNTDENLKEWIQKHQHTSRVEKKFQDVLAPGLLILLSFEVVVLGLVVYACAKVEMNILNRAVVACFTFGFFTKLFIITRCGDHITHESSRITEEGFGALWYELPLKAQHSLKVIICRAKRNVTISAKGFFHLNTNTFRTFALSSYSYYTLLAEME